MLKDLIVKIVFDVFITHLLFCFKFINSQIGFPILGGSTENVLKSAAKLIGICNWKYSI